MGQLNDTCCGAKNDRRHHQLNYHEQLMKNQFDQIKRSEFRNQMLAPTTKSQHSVSRPNSQEARPSWKMDRSEASSIPLNDNMQQMITPSKKAKQNMDEFFKKQKEMKRNKLINVPTTYEAIPISVIRRQTDVRPRGIQRQDHQQ